MASCGQTAWRLAPARLEPKQGMEELDQEGPFEGSEPGSVEEILRRMRQMDLSGVRVEGRLRQLEAFIAESIHDRIALLEQAVRANSEQLREGLGLVARAAGAAAAAGAMHTCLASSEREHVRAMQVQLQQAYSQLDAGLTPLPETAALGPTAAAAELESKEAGADELVVDLHTSVPKEAAVVSPAIGGPGGSDIGPKVPALDELVVDLHTPLPRGVPLSESIWDTIIVLGHSSVGTGGSLMLLLLLLVNVTAQTFFIWSIFQISGPQFDEHFTEEWAAWRRNVGQNVKYYDSLTLSSLTERVCSRDRISYPVEMSTSVADLVGHINAYLPGEDTGAFGFVGKGAGVLVLALLLWSLKAMEELRAVCNLIEAVCSVPRGHLTCFVCSGSSFRLASLSSQRLGLSVVVLLLRLIGCLALWLCGTAFLVRASIDSGELILNAIALDVVLCIDEEIFTLAPARVKSLLASLEPLSPPPRKLGRSGMGLESGTLLLVLLASMACTWVGFVKPQIRHLVEANHTLCGGNQSFVFGLDGSYILYATQSNPLNMSLDAFDAFPYSHAINALIWNQLDKLPVLPEMHVVPSFAFPQSVLHMSSVSSEQSSDTLQDAFGGKCRDLLDRDERLVRYVNYFWNAESVTGSVSEVEQQAPIQNAYQEVVSCADVKRKGLCLGRWLSTQLCPETCGCSDPAAGAYFVVTLHSCPLACAGSEAWFAGLRDLDCRDADAEERTGAWLQWAEEFHSIMSFGGLDGICGGSCREWLLNLGCGVIPVWRAIAANRTEPFGDPCIGNWVGPIQTRPLAPVCPETCGCKLDYDASICPLACRS